MNSFQELSLWKIQRNLCCYLSDDSSRVISANSPEGRCLRFHIVGLKQNRTYEYLDHVVLILGELVNRYSTIMSLLISVQFPV